MEFDIIRDALDFCSSLPNSSPCKKRKKLFDCSSYVSNLPFLRSPDYYIEPALDKLAEMERINPGYCGKVRDFTVGRLGFGNVRFFDYTDVRGLDVEEIVRFDRHEIVVYEDESAKPPIGEGLNKPALVTLILKVDKGREGCDGVRFGKFVDRLRFIADRQGAEFVSYEPGSGEWKFRVGHFSRFGLSLDDEDDIAMDDADVREEDEIVMNGVVDGNVGEDDDVSDDMGASGPELSHSLPAHLGLDPGKMRDMRMMMFSGDGDEDDESVEVPSREEHRFYREKSPLYNSGLRTNCKASPPLPRKTPVPLLEYKSSNLDVNASGTLLLSNQNKGFPSRLVKTEGFKLETDCDTPISGYHSRNVVDAGLFMSRSFRVGWGPNGVLVHCGMSVHDVACQGTLSSVITLEKVAIDGIARDENNEVKKEAVDLLFDSPLDLHKSLDHGTEVVEIRSFKLSLQKPVCDRLALSATCRRYIDVVEKQLEVLPAPSHLSLMHQITVWELIKVLFSERETSERSMSGIDDHEEDMILDGKDRNTDIDLEALPLMRRAEFSYWLQDAVYHRVQSDVSSLNSSSNLQQIFLFLTGRQLDAAVELAASVGDVRLACLLSEAGGSLLNRSDVAQQLDLWRINGMNFNFIEKDRLQLLELLSGNTHSALAGKKIDWKRFLGLLMWYELPPDTALPDVFHTYQHLLTTGKAPDPVPVYIDEGPADDTSNVSIEGQFDLAYYLMLLHANKGDTFGYLKSMFSGFASTNDPLDYHMIWHQRGMLEAIGAFSCKDLHILDMSYVSQLLCLGKCHWAIYVVLHIPYREDFHDLHFSVIREILFQYCEIWSSQEEQRKFIEDLGIPSQWLHEALAVYYHYYGDLLKALKHYLECACWQKAHSIFITSVVHSLFLSAEDNEIWRLATSMEDYKTEIEDWDLGAGVYISFYLLRSSLQDSDNNSTKESLESKEKSCKEFFDRLNKSLEVLGSRFPLDARVAYSRMSEQICSLLLSDTDENSTRETQLSCFDTVSIAPIPEDLRSCHLEDAVSVYTRFLREAAV